MDNDEFIKEFNNYIEKDEDYMVNVIYDELAEYCMESNIENVTEEQLLIMDLMKKISNSHKLT